MPDTGSGGDDPPTTSATFAVEVRVSAAIAHLLRDCGLVIDVGRSRAARAVHATPKTADPEIEGFLGGHPLADQVPSDPIAATLLQCDLLDHFGVPMGNKGIGIFMHRRWSAGIAARYGPARPPATLRRCRASGRGPRIA